MHKIPTLSIKGSAKPCLSCSIKINPLVPKLKPVVVKTTTKTSLHFNVTTKNLPSRFYTTSRNVFCHECGTRGIGRFCWNCGTKLFDPSQSAPEQRQHIEKSAPVHNPFQQVPHQPPIHQHNAPPKPNTPPQPQPPHPFEFSESEMFPYMFTQSPPPNLQQLAEQQQQLRKQEIQKSFQNNINVNPRPNPLHANIPKEPANGMPLGNIFGSAVGAGLGTAAARQAMPQQHQPSQPPQEDKLTAEELARELEEFAEEQQLLNALQRNPRSLEEEALDEEPLEEEEEPAEEEEEEHEGEEDDDGQPIRLHVIYPDRL